MRDPQFPADYLTMSSRQVQDADLPDLVETLASSHIDERITSTNHLLGLPAEIRNKIYDHLVVFTHPDRYKSLSTDHASKDYVTFGEGDLPPKCSCALNLFLTCKQLHVEPYSWWLQNNEVMCYATFKPSSKSDFTYPTVQDNVRFLTRNGPGYPGKSFNNMLRDIKFIVVVIEVDRTDIGTAQFANEPLGQWGMPIQQFFDWLTNESSQEQVIRVVFRLTGSAQTYINDTNYSNAVKDILSPFHRDQPTKEICTHGGSRVPGNHRLLHATPVSS